MTASTSIASSTTHEEEEGSLSRIFVVVGAAAVLDDFVLAELLLPLIAAKLPSPPPLNKVVFLGVIFPVRGLKEYLEEVGVGSDFLVFRLGVSSAAGGGERLSARFLPFEDDAVAVSLDDSDALVFPLFDRLV